MKKVLIVEDDGFYQKIYKKKFEISGFEVEVADDGEEGLAKMESFKPDIVFLDLMMPKMDGFEMITKIKASKIFKDIPVVALTNLSTADDANQILQKGAIEVLVKSNIEPSAVVAKAKEILKLEK